MAFCDYSSEKRVKETIQIENLFFSEFLPAAKPEYIKVYMYGLFLCQMGESSFNTLEKFSEVLKMSKEDVLGSFMYWQEQGLVKVVSLDEFLIKYLPIRRNSSREKEILNGKYSEFNSNMQEIISGRMITPTEYLEYMNFLEISKMEPKALLCIARYCATIKNNEISYNYILTIAKNWAYKKLLTFEDVMNEIETLNMYDSDLKELLKIFNIRREPYFEEKELWNLIANEWQFDKNVIYYVAKNLKLKNKSALERLKEKLNKYYALKLYSVEEIETYESKKQNYYDTAKMVTKTLGLYYENLEPIIETYITLWDNYGYDDETLKMIASYCFKNSIRTLEGMNNRLEKFFKLGLVTSTAINEYISQIVKTDKQIKAILEKLGVNRNVNAIDREMFKVWTYAYSTPEPLFEYAITLCIGKNQPMQYLNKILSKYHENGIITVEDAKKRESEFTAPMQSNYIDKKNVIETHNYTSEEINAFFTNIDEIKL